jgi:hypothetical protein
MKVLVTGSRKFADPFAASLAINERIANLPAGVTVIHGGALGADQMAAEAAERLGLPIQAFYADWDKHGKKAGIIRNLQMLAERPDLVIAFWNGSSRGTGHTITEARKRSIPVEVIPLV